MNRFLMYMIDFIYTAHNEILGLNDAYEYNFTDKELHFLVIGVIGMLMIWAVYPFFKWLAKHNHIMTITFIYVFTLVVVLTFSIEIGQKAGNNGSMEFADIVFGVVGFLAMFIVFAIVRGIFHLIIRLVKKTAVKNKEKQHQINT